MVNRGDKQCLYQVEIAFPTRPLLVSRHAKNVHFPLINMHLIREFWIFITAGKNPPFCVFPILQNKYLAELYHIVSYCIAAFPSRWETSRAIVRGKSNRFQFPNGSNRHYGMSFDRGGYWLSIWPRTYMCAGDVNVFVRARIECVYIETPYVALHASFSFSAYLHA